MLETKAERHFRVLTHYHRATPEQKPALLGAFLDIEVRVETDPKLRQRLLLLVEQEKQRLEIA